MEFVVLLYRIITYVLKDTESLNITYIRYIHNTYTYKIMIYLEGDKPLLI